MRYYTTSVEIHCGSQVADFVNNIWVETFGFCDSSQRDEMTSISSKMHTSNKSTTSSKTDTSSKTPIAYAETTLQSNAETTKLPNGSVDTSYPIVLLISIQRVAQLAF